MQGACPWKFFKIPLPIVGAPKCGVHFFLQNPIPYWLLRRITEGGKRPGYFLKSQAKSPAETANYKVTTTHSLRRDLLQGGMRAWQMFGANSYAFKFGGAFPSCLRKTCLFAQRGSHNVWAKKTPYPQFLGRSRVYTRLVIPSAPPPGSAVEVERRAAASDQTPKPKAK